MRKIMKINYRWIIICLFIIILYSQPALGSDSPQGEVLFRADLPTDDGTLIVHMSISNATFNAYQFALKYDVGSLVPIDSKGVVATHFNEFAIRAYNSDALSAIGTKLNAEAGLIEFAGYVQPGYKLVTGDQKGRTGYAAIDREGYEIYQFRFRIIVGSRGANLALATEASGYPYSASFPEGGALFDAGYRVPIKIAFDLPALPKNNSDEASGGGQGGTIEDILIEQEDMVFRQRLRNTLVLRIGDYLASQDGQCVAVDTENFAVHPYIDLNGRTMVPIRFIAEKLGAAVHWDGIINQITISSDDHTVIMSIGSKTYTIDGFPYVMDTEPIIVKGWNRTLVPVRFLAEALGRSVEWDPVNHLVFITPKSIPWVLDGEVERRMTTLILEEIYCSEGV